MRATLAERQKFLNDSHQKLEIFDIIMQMKRKGAKKKHAKVITTEEGGAKS